MHTVLSLVCRLVLHLGRVAIMIHALLGGFLALDFCIFVYVLKAVART
jgi:hypothetical protein